MPLKTLDRMLRSKLCYAIIPLGFFLLYLSLASQLNMNEAPDEHMRLALTFYIYSNHELPIGPEPSIVSPIWGFSYAYTAYGPSIAAVPFVAIASLFTQDLSALVIAARLVSVICGSLTVFVSMRIGRRLFSEPAMPILLGFLIGLLPQFAFLSAYQNNDLPSACACSIIILAWVRGLQDGWDLKTSLLLGLGIGCCAISYYFGFGFIVVSLVVFFYSGLSSKSKGPGSVKRLFLLALVVLLVAIACGGWYYIRNAFIYSPTDIFGFSARNELAEAAAQTGFKPSDHATPQRTGMSIIEMVFGSWDGRVPWLPTTLKSFVGYFGYMIRPLSDELYAAYAVVMLPGLIGVVVFRNAISKAITERRSGNLLRLSLLATIAFAFLFSVYFSWSADFEPQGRYLYSALVPIMIFVVCGIESLIAAIAGLLAGNNGSRKAIAKSVLFSVILVAYIGMFIASFEYLSPSLTGVAPIEPLYTIVGRA